MDKVGWIWRERDLPIVLPPTIQAHSLPMSSGGGGGGGIVALGFSVQNWWRCGTSDRLLKEVNGEVVSRSPARATILLL